MNIGRLLVLTLVVVFAAASIYALSPSGATLSTVNSSSAPEDNAGSDTSALAGNVTIMNIFGFTTTQSWQGYAGNVTGTIQLADSSDNVMYNWSLASPEGEVYASTDNSITWSSIDCFDVDANGGAFETAYNIAADDVDGLNETFRFSDHTAFFTANVQHTTGECNNTWLYTNNGSGLFEEVLLTDDGGTTLIFASLLKEADTTGFDNTFYDFQMVVLEDGHGTDTSTSTYYFWVELE
jgi:hypothetical protein